MRHAYKIMCNRLSIMICGFFCLATPLSLATEHTRSFIEYPGYSFWFNTAYYAYPTEVYIVSYTGTAETLEVPDRIHYTWDGYPTAPNVEADAIVLGERWGNYSDHYTHFQNTHIRNVTFPSAFTEFPPSMFYGSYNLRRVSALKVSVAGGSCFSCCSNLVSVVMPELSNIKLRFA